MTKSVQDKGQNPVNNTEMDEELMGKIDFAIAYPKNHNQMTMRGLLVQAKQRLTRPQKQVTRGDLDELIYMIDDTYKAPEAKRSLATEWLKERGVEVVK